LGISDRQLRGPAFRPVFPGVLVHAAVPDTVVVRSRAALLVAPEGGVISHWTAARLWGGRVPDNDWLHVSYMRDVRFRTAGVRTHRFRHRLHILHRHGLPVTSPEQTFCHLARFLGLVDLVAFGDSIARKGRLVPAELVGYADDWVGQCRDQALAAARLVRPRVDSSPETALRLLMVLGGLPEPDVDIQIRDDDGTLRFRLDLGYEAARLAIEYDGRWHDEDAQREHDVDRRQWLHDKEGWTFVVVGPEDLFGDPEGLLVRLEQALRACGVATPPLVSQAWRAHFRVARVAA
jgi:very-short-patch-repair endonuclease